VVFALQKFSVGLVPCAIDVRDFCGRLGGSHRLAGGIFHPRRNHCWLGVWSNNVAENPERVTVWNGFLRAISEDGVAFVCCVYR
jgi:hypothetical protein